jgi:CubicO group peptidase (beta-lactamase class C family)
MTNLLSSFPRLLALHIACVLLFLLLAGCSSSDSFSPNYTATIAEGRSAATDIMKKTGASSISIALIDGKTLVWAETFGYADENTKTRPTTETMYGICSLSKILATIAVMKLEDDKQISLHAPVKTYLSSFSMLSPEYTQITVNMLLNHSSGFPGAEYRNAVSLSPLTFSYSAQVMETLSKQRLKHAPGYLSVYCDDGFTVIEELVLAVTGKSYVQFVQDEILTPLGMNHSLYPVNYFPAGSFAKVHENGIPQPQPFLNVFASGGLFSTPSDMGKIAMMLMGKGKLGNVRILSEKSVAAMGVDQTLDNFNPVKAYAWSYGLGLDTVVQPGLRAVGVIGWHKTGDYTGMGSVITMAPDEGLAVVVAGVSGSFSSSKATIIAERILLRALMEKGRLAIMPTPLTFSPLPEKTPTDELLDAVCGYYANFNSFYRVQRQANTLTISLFDVSINGWKDIISGLKLREDDRFSRDADPSSSFSFITADGRRYMVKRSVLGYGHYQDDTMFAQQVAPAGPMPASWNGRLGKTWLMTNEHPEYLSQWESPVMRLRAVDNMLFNNVEGLQIVDPFLSDTRAGMMLLIPQENGGDLKDVDIEIRGGEEWIRLGSYLYRPQETVKSLSSGTVSIGVEGLAEWRSLDTTYMTKTVTITPAVAGGCWKIYNSDFTKMETGGGIKSITLSGGMNYFLFHNTATVNLM